MVGGKDNKRAERGPTMPGEDDYTRKKIDEIVGRVNKQADACVDTHSKVSDRLAEGAKTMGIMEHRIKIMEEWAEKQNRIMNSFRERVETQLGNQTKIMIGLLVALATTSVLLALNILLMRDGTDVINLLL